SSRLWQHLDRHLAVGFGAAEINQDRDALLRPGLVDGRHDRFDIGSKSAIWIAAAPTERHVVTNHLLDHRGGASRDIGRMRHDDDSDIIAHAQPSITSATASTINADERAPGSM